MILQLKIERLKRGWNQMQLCLKSGLPQWRISLLERGVTPKTKEAEILATLFEKSPDELFMQIKD